MLKNLFIFSTAIFLLQCAVPQAVDQTPPTVTITFPQVGQSLPDTVKVKVEATDDDSGISKVEFYVDGAYMATDKDFPYEFTWDTNPYRDGSSHSIYVKAYDKADNVTISEIRSFTIGSTNGSGDVIAPSVALTYPLSGQVIYKDITIRAEATDNIAVSKVDFFVDGDLKFSDTKAPYEYDWPATQVADGASHSIYVKATDTAGNEAFSSIITVTVISGSSNDVTPPTIALLYPVGGTTVSGTITIACDAQDNVGVTKVEFYIDGILNSIDTSAPWKYDWNTDAYADGQVHSIYLKAFDANGNFGDTPVTLVTVAAP